MFPAHRRASSRLMWLTIDRREFFIFLFTRVTSPSLLIYDWLRETARQLQPRVPLCLTLARRNRKHVRSLSLCWSSMGHTPPLSHTPIHLNRLSLVAAARTLTARSLNGSYVRGDVFLGAPGRRSATPSPPSRDARRPEYKVCLSVSV